MSRLETLVDGKGQTTGYTYDPLDRQDVVTYHDGSTVDQTWDTDGNRAVIMALAKIPRRSRVSSRGRRMIRQIDDFPAAYIAAAGRRSPRHEATLPPPRASMPPASGRRCPSSAQAGDVVPAGTGVLRG